MIYDPGGENTNRCTNLRRKSPRKFRRSEKVKEFTYSVISMKLRSFVRLCSARRRDKRSTTMRSNPLRTSLALISRNVIAPVREGARTRNACTRGSIKARSRALFLESAGRRYRMCSCWQTKFAERTRPRQESLRITAEIPFGSLVADNKVPHSTGRPTIHLHAHPYVCAYVFYLLAH